MQHNGTDSAESSPPRVSSHEGPLRIRISGVQSEGTSREISDKANTGSQGTPVLSKSSSEEVSVGLNPQHDRTAFVATTVATPKLSRDSDPNGNR